LRLRTKATDQQLNNSAGFTLIELVVITVLIAIISTLAISKVDSVVVWRQKSEVRKFANVWQFLYNEALGRQQTYRLVIDLDNQNYYVRREIQVTQDLASSTDLLSGFRDETEFDRAKNKNTKKGSDADDASLEEEYKEAQAIEGDALDQLFFKQVFADPSGQIELRTPLEFPSLAEKRSFTGGLKFKQVKLQNEQQNSGEVFIRITPTGAATFAVVYLQIDDYVFTVVMNPSTGQIMIKDGEHDFKWLLGKKTN
jgi:type II secretory pathway pseudopilin PulG